ncbi:LacI family DNA-binding transcriptional regulator [Sphingomonas sp. AOB5]|uniref:LacI family DNA-binding transcriptional regulator n=1 Tax=Sphingomonas sp. AOB5 TaxID=3034017 RepID=UPI0023F99F1E|nr:LacI family DNA-binding transcriptional regulator [Sphingomonas sp. AOB5]MDF7775552.1 LacI family DNA-binding transcriptional regulator [Sphingomonas sp. AOB5]
MARPRSTGTGDNRRITIIDLADKLGVSPTTISRALRSKGGMSEETRDRIRKAAELHGYVPNKAGAALSTGRVFSIGYIVPKDARGYPSQLQADVMRGLVEELAKSGYSLTVYSEDYFLAEGTSLLEAGHKIRADALVVTIEHSDPVAPPAQPLPLPLMVVNRRLEGIDADFILADEERGGLLAVDHLLGLGHRGIAFVGGPSDHAAMARRREGYADALAEAGIAYDADLVEHRDEFSWQAGHAACAALLDRAGGRFTGIFCGSDILAFGVLKCLEERGLAVPGDIAVASFDDSMFADIADPALTSVRKPRYAMGQYAARRLIQRLDNDAAPGEIVLPVELIVRASSTSRRD